MVNNALLKAEDEPSLKILRPVCELLDRNQAIRLKDEVVDDLLRGHKNFLADMTGVKKANSRGMSILLATIHMIERDGGVSFWGLTEELKLLFSFAGLSNRQQEAPSLAEARLLFEAATSNQTRRSL